MNAVPPSAAPSAFFAGQSFTVASRGGDERKAVLLGRVPVLAHHEAASWLRSEALRLAVRLDPGPVARWLVPGVARPVLVRRPDAPAALRAWAEDVRRQSRVRELLALGCPFTLRCPDVGGSWYELGARPIPPNENRPAQKPGTPMPPSGAPDRCDAETDIPEIMGIFAKRASLGVPGGNVVTRTRCGLATHEGVEHVGVVRPLAEGAVWVTFTREVPPYQARRLPPCPCTQPGSQPCGLFPGHPGGCLPATTSARE
ncbi:formylmethionine deformylase [Streptomyces sp. SID11385]|uniref:formylmethionine deformylase n=1 Tax=Streptomyces sp. SID11385 TaxID=2706031 RepID=UPI0013C63815|nr:formylmethionine deformylase [Streptomyces sp. SID11385]NEA40201.1 formylmethionine deformylase [Streptomyces sp. SID11385]